MGVPTLNEGSRCFIKAKFYDNQARAQIPNSIAYRVDCETTGTLIQDWTPVTPDVQVEVQIDATLNKIINQRNPLERKVVTFLANADPAANAFTEIQSYDLIGLQAEET